jgi:hypothetical protein
MEPEEVERVLNYGGASQLWDVDQDRHSLYDFHNPAITCLTCGGDQTNILPTVKIPKSRLGCDDWKCEDGVGTV